MMKSGQLCSKSHDRKPSQESVECSLKLNIYSYPIEREKKFQFYSLITKEILEELGADSFCEELQSITSNNGDFNNLIVHEETIDDLKIPVRNLTPVKNEANLFNQNDKLLNCALVERPERNKFTSSESDPPPIPLKLVDDDSLSEKNVKEKTDESLEIKFEPMSTLVFKCSSKESGVNEYNNSGEDSNKTNLNSENLVTNIRKDLVLVEKSDQPKVQIASISEEIFKSTSSVSDFNSEKLVDENKDLDNDYDKLSNEFLKNTFNKSQLTFELYSQTAESTTNKEKFFVSESQKLDEFSATSFKEIFHSTPINLNPLLTPELSPDDADIITQNKISINEFDELSHLHPLRIPEVTGNSTIMKSDKSFNEAISQGSFNDDSTCILNEKSFGETTSKDIAHDVYSTPPKSGQQPLVFGFSPEMSVNPPTFPDCTPERIALSLGVSLGEHNLSWVKSMETPSLKSSKLIEDCLNDTSLLEQSKDFVQKSSVTEKLKMETTEDYLESSSFHKDLDISDGSFVIEKDIYWKPVSTNFQINESLNNIDDCCSAISSNSEKISPKKTIPLNENDCNSECATDDANKIIAKTVSEADCCKDVKCDETTTSEIKDGEPVKLSHVHCKMCCSQSAIPVNDSQGLQHGTAYVVLLNDIPPGMYRVLCNGDLQLTPAENVNFTENEFLNSQLHQEKLTTEKEINNQENFDVVIDEVNIAENVEFETMKDLSSKSSKFAGFSTASGKKVNVSESALSNARRWYEETLSNCNSKNMKLNDCNLIAVENLKNAKELPFGNCTSEEEQVKSRGFFTASNKQIEISHQALTKAKAIYDEVEKTDLLPLKKSHFSMIKSSDNQTLIKKSCDNNISVNTEKSDTTELEPLVFPSKFQGFSTGLGKIITVNKESLSKARQLLTTINEVDAEVSTNKSKDFDGYTTSNDILENETNVRASTSNSFGGFSTASGKAVTISEEALLKAKEKLLDSEANVKLSSSHSFGGFATASGKAVSVSEEALIKAKEKLLDGEPNVKSSTGNSFGGFATASGKAVSISEEALIKAKEKLLDGETNVKPSTSNSFCGFSTASGKAVPISEEALIKAKEKLLDGEANVKPSSSNSFGGFSTASGKTVSVSEEALIKAKEKLLDGEANVKQSTSNSFGGFATASGKAVSVSEEALIKAKKKLLEDEIIANSYGDEQIETRSGKKHCHSISGTPERKTLMGRKRLKVSRESSPAKEISKEDWEDIAADFFLDDETCVKDSDPAENPEVSPLKKSKDLTTEIQMSMAALLADETESKDEDSGSSCSQVAKAKRKNVEFQSTPRRSKRLRGKGSQMTEHEKPVAFSSILKKRNEASKSRWERLVKKQKKNITSVMGEVWQNKHRCREKRMQLADFTEILSPRMHTAKLLKCGVMKSVLSITSANSEDYCFIWEEAAIFAPSAVDGILNVDCGAVLIFSEDNRLGKDEFYDGLIDLKGVDQNLISKRWVFNHYRWIIWKLSSLEKALPESFGGRLLSPNSVLNQLQYRYNVEIDKSKRSIIKKLFEQDDTPTKTMILCVSNIFHEPTKSAINGGINSIELTDGWYKIKAVIDERLSILILSGKIFIGLKLIIFGCEFVSTFEPCDPLEASETVSLQLNANSCRRARWDSKLGEHFTRNQSVPLRSLYGDGGRVSCLDVLIVRVYPMQYLEKKEDGSFLVFNDRTNDRANRLFEESRNSHLEDLKKKILTEFEEQEDKKKRRMSRRFLNRGNMSRGEIESLNSGEEISEILETSSEPSLIENYLSEYQKSKLIEYKINEGDKKRQLMEKALESKAKVVKQRVVIPFLKFSAIGLTNVDLESEKCALITIWKPSHDLEPLLKEGKTIRIFNLCAEKKGDEKVLNLKSTPQVKFIEVPDKTLISERIFVPREVSAFNQMGDGFKPVYGVVDIVGVVIKSRLKEHGRFDCVYLADASMDIIMIKFWDGLKAFCLEDVLIPETFIYATNLQWRGKTNPSIQSVYASETTVFTQRPRNIQIRSILDELEKLVMSDRQFFDKANEKINKLTNNHPFIPAIGTSFFGKPVSASTPLSRGRKEMNAFGDGSFTKHLNTSISPMIDVNKRVDNKMKSLEMYGEPPPLLPLQRANLMGVRRGFKPPLKSNNP